MNKDIIDFECQIEEVLNNEDVADFELEEIKKPVQNSIFKKIFTKNK